MSQNFGDGAEEVQLPAGEELVTGDDDDDDEDGGNHSGHSNHDAEMDSSNTPLNLVATQFAD